jgi:glycosyltransferase involved in cell wall biosynthesis
MVISLLQSSSFTLAASNLRKPSASVVITTRNRKEELRDAIKSALAQTVSVEVLVIDDGSTDGTSDMIRTIDDDAIFKSPLTVVQTLSEFEHPRVGAVAIPYIEPRKSPLVCQQAPSKDGIFVTDSFIGTAHAVRKDVFLRIGGYRDYLVHQGEEMDFCIRMMEARFLTYGLLRSPERCFVYLAQRAISLLSFSPSRNDG